MNVDSFVFKYCEKYFSRLNNDYVKELLLYRLTEQNKKGKLGEYINEIKSGKSQEIKEHAKRPEFMEINIKFIADNSRIDNMLFINSTNLIYYLDLSEDVNLANIDKIEDKFAEMEADDSLDPMDM